MNRQTKYVKFTLLELLIVIAMIAILAGLLLPALNAAREKARSVICINNLKTWGQASILYQGTFDDFCVPFKMCGARGGRFLWYAPDSWLVHSVFPNVGYTGAPTAATPLWIARKYFNGCPSDNGQDTNRENGYIMNYDASFDALDERTTPPLPKKITQIRNPSSVIQIAEYGEVPPGTTAYGFNNCSTTQTAPGNPDCRIFYRHTGRCNVIMVAGNVVSAKWFRPSKGYNFDQLTTSW